MNINEGKKIGTAAALAAMFAGGSMSSAFSARSFFTGAVLTFAAAEGTNVFLNKSIGNWTRKKLNAEGGLLKKWWPDKKTDEAKK